jgi:hypothetical protein
MVRHLLLLLGMPEGATVSDIKKKYAQLLQRLGSGQGQSNDHLRLARERLSESYEYWKKTGEKELTELSAANDLGCNPKLGQLLVGSGRLSFEDLKSFLDIHAHAEIAGLKFGELLVASGYINDVDLDYFLRLQRLVEFPPDHPERWGQRLVELGLISEDQLKIALFEHTQTNCTLRQALINRGWLTAAVLDRIF